MILLDRLHTVPHLHPYMAQFHIYRRMILLRHRISLAKARTIPTSTTVHSVFIKKLSYPLSNRPDELLGRGKDT